MFHKLQALNPLKKLTAASRITLVLVSSMLSILILANLANILPDKNEAVRLGRKQITESLAFSAVVLLANNDMVGLDVVLENTILRSHQIRSIGVRQQSDGALIAVAGDHQDAWPKDISEKSDSEFMHLPLKRDNGEVWGEMEVAFKPDTWLSSFQNSFASLFVFCGLVGFAVFRVFLKVVLKNLDPSKAVPRRVREALDILNEGLMIVSLDDRILLANNSFATLAQCDADSLVGRRASDIQLRRVDGTAVMPWTQCGATQKAVSGVTMEFQHPTLGHRVFKTNCSPLFGDEGTVRGVMVSLDDVTILEQNKVELKLAKDEADAANKAKGDFLANMSHEIRNPMNAIVGFTDILRRGLEDSDETRTSYLNTIHASGTHLVELINDILDFSKIEAGKLDLEIRECSPYELMMEVVSVLRMKAEQQSLELTVCIDGQIPETIMADPTRLRQILMNLTSNAIKFTETGSVKIIASSQTLNDKSFIRFDIKDTGIGMTRDQMGRLFQEFMQADSSVTRRFGGTGLGLAISKRLTEAMGGQISVDSVPQEGSTFSFSIETGSLANVAMLTQAEITQKYSETAPKHKSGLKIWFKPARVLITDDTPANRQLAGLVLRKAGLTVEEAENGAIAVEKASSDSYDLILMDMQMPVMDGITATRTLRDRGLNIPILAFTANVMEQDRLRCLAAGCTGFLTKPINIDLLLSTMAQYLETSSTPPVEFISPALLCASIDQGTVQSHSVTSSEMESAPSDGFGSRVTESSALSSIDFIDSLVNRLADPCANAAGLPDNKCCANTPNQMETDNQIHVRTNSARKPIYTMLPMDIPEFQEIVESFVNSIGDTMQSLEVARNNVNYSEIREIAHRLKGTGGTVGFPDFTEPSRKLQFAAEKYDDAMIDAMLIELADISSRIAVMSPVMS